MLASRSRGSALMRADHSSPSVDGTDKEVHDADETTH